MQLTLDQKDHFHQRGWLVVKGLVDLAEVRAAGSEFEGVHEVAWQAEQGDGRLPWDGAGASWDPTTPAGAPPRIEQMIGSEAISPALRRIGHSGGVVDVVDQLIDPDQDIRFFHSKMLMRPACAQSRFPWHQDFGYWHYSHHRPQQLNCAIAIEAQTAESGCLKYVEGSHRAGLREHHRLERGVVSSFPILLSDDLAAYDAVPAEYEPGDAIFFGPLVIHGSDINRSGRQARFNTFAYDLGGNTRSDHFEPMVREKTQRIHALVH